MALKNGLIEAQENTSAEINDLKLYEVQTNMIETGHIPYVSIFVMNKEMYDGLTDEEKEWLSQFVSQAEQDTINAVAEDETSQETKFGEKKMAVSQPSTELEAALDGAVQAVIDSVKQTAATTLWVSTLQPAAIRKKDTTAGNGGYSAGIRFSPKNKRRYDICSINLIMTAQYFVVKTMYVPQSFTRR